MTTGDFSARLCVRMSKSIIGVVTCARMFKPVQAPGTAEGQQRNGPRSVKQAATALKWRTELQGGGAIISPILFGPNVRRALTHNPNGEHRQPRADTIPTQASGAAYKRNGGKIPKAVWTKESLTDLHALPFSTASVQRGRRPKGAYPPSLSWPRHP